MAGKSGGSWKVAYADFVTAMMAFFLVMWIGSQDAKTRQSVANYFIDPSGAAKKPTRAGAVMDSPSEGPVPKNESLMHGRGRESHSTNEHSHPTKLVSDWLNSDEKARKYWQDQVKQAREVASNSKEVQNKQLTEKEFAIARLTRQLRDEMTRNVPVQGNSVYQDLLFGSFSEINWKELAEDLIGK